MKNRYLIFFFLMLIISSCSLFGGRKNQVKNQEVVRNVRQSELNRILESKELKVVVDYNSTNYFVYRGQPMGFQYELLNALASDMGVELNVIVSNSLEETFYGLNKSYFDLIAKNLTVTKERSELVDFTEPIALTRQVLVQRNSVRSLTDATSKNKYVSDQLELGGKTVYVQKNTVFVQRLKNLSDEIGEPIHLVEDSVYGVEQLIALVASGEIDYTVCDENVALVNKSYYPWIDISVPLSFKQKLSWAVRKNSTEWKEYIDKWIIAFKETEKYQVLYNKYFSGARVAHSIHSEFHSINRGRISEYDELVKEISTSYNWDWRLIASIIMQESGFDKNAISWAGAEGLMQLMPQTAQHYGVINLNDPRQSITGGIQFLENLNTIFEPLIEDEQERMKFILASYNVGAGHVIDARNLAIKFNKNPDVWKDNVEYYLLKKSSPKYYRDPDVKWGYCRGEDPCNYVNKVLGCYQHYLNVLPDAKNVTLVSLPVLQSSLR